jgi:hypothetical protein
VYNPCRSTDIPPAPQHFGINETYPNSMRGAVLNTFNIREILEIFNLLYTRYFSEKTEPENGNDDIDNYLNGKIKND